MMIIVMLKQHPCSMSVSIQVLGESGFKMLRKNISMLTRNSSFQIRSLDSRKIMKSVVIMKRLFSINEINSSLEEFLNQKKKATMTVDQAIIATFFFHWTHEFQVKSKFSFFKILE